MFVWRHDFQCTCFLVHVKQIAMLAEVTDPLGFSFINQMKTICLEKLSNPLFLKDEHTTQNFILMDFSIFFCVSITPLVQLK